MDNRSYEIRRDYLEGEDLLLSLSQEDRQKVEDAIESLAKNPVAKQLGWRRIDERSFKITVPIEIDEIVIIYEVDFIKATIDLVQIKRLGQFEKARKWLSGLAYWVP